MVGLELISRILGSTFRPRKRCASNLVLQTTLSAKEAVSILAELCDLAVVHAHKLVEADWEGEQLGVEPAFFYYGQ